HQLHQQGRIYRDSARGLREYFTHPGNARSWPGELGPLGVQELCGRGEIQGAVPRGGFECFQYADVLGSECVVWVRVIRADYVAGGFFEDDPVGDSDVLLVEPKNRSLTSRLRNTEPRPSGSRPYFLTGSSKLMVASEPNLR